MTRFPWILLLAMLLAGCSGFGGSKEVVDPPAELPEIESSVQLKRLWSRSLGVGTDGQFVRLQIAFLGGELYGADRKGRVWALNADDGKTLWETNTDALISAGVGVGEGLVVLGTADGDVLALDRTDGSVKWRSRVPSEILSVPQVDRGIVVVQAADGTVTGLNVDDGSRAWIYDRTVPVLTLRGTSTPVVGSGAVVAGFASGKLVAMRVDIGRVMWERGIAVPSGRSELERMVDLDGDPVLYGDNIYATTFQGMVASLDVASGQVRWSREMSSYMGLGVDFSQVYVADDKSHLWALNRRNGATLWKQDVLNMRVLSRPAAFDDYVVAGDFEGYLHLFSRLDGELVGRARGDQAGISQVRPVGDRLYVYGRGGGLSVYTLASGS